MDVLSDPSTSLWRSTIVSRELRELSADQDRRQRDDGRQGYSVGGMPLRLKVERVRGVCRPCTEHVAEMAVRER